MKKKILSFVLATMLVSTTGIPIMAQAEELPVATEEAVAETPVAETPVTEEPTVKTPAAETTEADKVVVEKDNEPIVIEDEAKTVSDEDIAAADAEKEASEKDKLDLEKDKDKLDLEKDKLEEEKEEETHEHDIIYIPTGDHQHKAMCAVGGDDCDFEETIEGCVDEDGDEFCDFCHQDLKEKTHQLASGITIEVKSWTPFFNEDGKKYIDFEGNEVGIYATYIPASCGSSERLSVDGIFEMIKNNDSISYGMNGESFFDLDGFDAVYNDLLAIGEEIPSNIYVTITERDGVIEDFTIDYEDNYVPEEERVYVEKEDPEAKALEAEDTDADTEDKEDEELLDDTVMAKEDEILPDRVVSDEVEDEANGEVVEDEQLIDDETAAEIMESIPDDAETETAIESTVDESPVAETAKTVETVAE